MNNQVAIQIVNNLDSCSKKFGYNFQVNDFSNIDEILIEISEEPLLEKWNFNIFITRLSVDKLIIFVNDQRIEKHSKIPW